MRDPFNSMLQQACTWGDAYSTRMLLRDDRIDPRHLNLLQLATQNEHLGTINVLLQDDRIRSDVNARALRDDSPSQKMYTFWNMYAQRQGKRRTYADEEGVYKRSNALIGEPLDVFVKNKDRFILLITKMTHSQVDFLSTLDQLTPTELERAINWMLLPDMSGAVKRKMQAQSVLQAFEEMATTATVFKLWNVYHLVTNIHILKQAALVRPQDGDSYAIFWAVYRNYPDLLKALLKDGRADPNQYFTPFLVAISSGDLELVSAFLKDGRVNPAKDANLALRYACEQGDPAMVQLLLADDRVDPTAQDHECMIVAARQGNVMILKELLTDRRVDIDIKRATMEREMEKYGSPIWNVWNDYIERKERRMNASESVIKRTKK